MPSLGWGGLAEASGSKFERVKGQGGAPGRGDRRDRHRGVSRTARRFWPGLLGKRMMVPFTEIESQAAEPGLEGKQMESAWQGQSLKDLWDLQGAMSRRLCCWMFRLGLRRDSGLQARLRAAPAPWA